jgi:endoglucanase
MKKVNMGIKGLWQRTNRLKQAGNSLLVLALMNPCAAQNEQQVRFNQLGFYTNGPKIAIVTEHVVPNKFYITGSNLRDTFFSGNLGSEMRSAYSNTTTRHADFSSFQRKGSYVLLVPGLPPSYIFRIGDDIHREVAIATLKGFYYQRSAMSLDFEYAGKWHRSAGHPDDIVYIHPSAASKKRPSGKIIPSAGGWYDAGDYNKYIVNSGITMATLLSAFEDFPDHFKILKTNIPESKDELPDILNEILYNLRWMMTMQDPTDGGVYHKCTNAVFDGMVMPGVTKDARYVVQKSTAATLDFAAVMAQAARVFKRFDSSLFNLSDSCFTAAEKAWHWASNNPNVLYEQDEMNQNFDPDITTGGYGDRILTDEWFWAAAELYLVSLNPKYALVLNKRFNDPARLPSWGNVNMLGYYSLLHHNKSLPHFQKQQQLKDTLIRMADGFIKRSASNAFATIMGQSERDFNWGGNANAANQGILLVQVYRLTKNRKYLDAAITNLDYILGRNATGYSFITGFGIKTPMHPHHRQSEADGIIEPVPGLMVGGPNSGMQDKCAYKFKEIETAYADVLCSYASNEIAINWNAPVVYLANAIEALKKEAGYVE